MERRTLVYVPVKLTERLPEPVYKKEAYWTNIGWIEFDRDEKKFNPKKSTLVIEWWLEPRILPDEVTIKEFLSHTTLDESRLRDMMLGANRVLKLLL